MYGFCLHCSEEAVSVECAKKHMDKLFLYINQFSFPIKVCDVTQVQFCHFCKKVIGVIEKYKEEFRPNNQTNIVDGICINPKQRYFFDCLNNDLRPDLEHRDWYGRSFVVTRNLSDSRENYDSYISRMSEYGEENESLPSRFEWEKKQNEYFSKNYHKSTRYFVQCYNGRAWDRSSDLGEFSSLSDAISFCKGEFYE
jgi:hypothetical protein